MGAVQIGGQSSAMGSNRKWTIDLDQQTLDLNHKIYFFSEVKSSKLLSHLIMAAERFRVMLSSFDGMDPCTDKKSVSLSWQVTFTFNIWGLLIISLAWGDLWNSLQWTSACVGFRLHLDWSVSSRCISALQCQCTAAHHSNGMVVLHWEDRTLPAAVPAYPFETNKYWHSSSRYIIPDF